MNNLFCMMLFGVSQQCISDRSKQFCVFLGERDSLIGSVSGSFYSGSAIDPNVRHSLAQVCHSAYGHSASVIDSARTFVSQLRKKNALRSGN